MGKLTKTPNNMLVQKSYPLISLVRSDITLYEYKILDTYLSRINSRKPEERVVVFEKGEIESLLGVDRIRKEVLEKRLANLMQPVRITDKDLENESILVPLMDKAHMIKEDSGTWRVELRCSEDVMKYFFNVEKIGYIKYLVSCATSIKSLYSYVLFLYIKSNEFRGTWEEDLDTLKIALNCEKIEYCNAFKRFNDKVLKPSFLELTEKKICDFSYETIKKGREVIGIRFKMNKIESLIEEVEILDERTE